MLGLFAVLLVAGCESRAQHRILATFVDGVPTYEEWLNPKPEERRRPPPQVVIYQQPAAFPEIGEQPRLAIDFGERPEIEALESWDEVLAALPKNRAGGPDWSEAVEEGVIRPASSLTPGEEGLQIFPLEVTLKGVLQTRFSHEEHTRWLACENCHTDLFPMAGGATEITMADLFAGKYCGVCHGTVVFDIGTGCALCHPQMGGG